VRRFYGWRPACGSAEAGVGNPSPAGHDAYPVTLTGLGEREHLASPEVDLETHITDVVNVVEFDDPPGRNGDRVFHERRQPDDDPYIRRRRTKS
jgi:hypothetical protein